jgi:hypothetical protein
VIASFPTCPIPEVARLGRTLRAWKQQVLAYFATAGVSNGGTEAINLVIEKTRASRMASGRSPSTGYGSCWRPTATAPTGAPMPESEEPLID